MNAKKQTRKPARKKTTPLETELAEVPKPTTPAPLLLGCRDVEVRGEGNVIAISSTRVNIEAGKDQRLLVFENGDKTMVAFELTLEQHTLLSGLLKQIVTPPTQG